MIEHRHIGKIGYLTIDEQELEAGKTLRRGGAHVDGYYRGSWIGAWGGANGMWGSVHGNGMLTVSNTFHCKAWLGIFSGDPGEEGECDHLTFPNEGELLNSHQAYWLAGTCVHESRPVEKKTKRQFVRLSLPCRGPWFEGYTKNPTGILPSHDILPAHYRCSTHGYVSQLSEFYLPLQFQALKVANILYEELMNKT